MTPRRLTLDAKALGDLRRHARFLAEKRGSHFAATYIDAFLVRLGRIADTGAVLGTRLPLNPDIRSFGYRGHATVLARYPGDQMIVVRVYFRGQDWLRGP